jgi:hypothetical protein
MAMVNPTRANTDDRFEFAGAVARTGDAEVWHASVARTQLRYRRVADLPGANRAQGDESGLPGFGVDRKSGRNFRRCRIFPFFGVIFAGFY